MTTKRILCAMVIASASVALLSANPVEAVTFTFDGAVTDRPFPTTIPPGMILPPLGAPGTVTLHINDSDPSRLLLPEGEHGPLAEVFSASLVVPGFLSGSIPVVQSDPPSLDATGFDIISYGPFSITNPGSAEPVTALQSFRFDFGPGLGRTPDTVGNLISVMRLLGGEGVYRHQIEQRSGVGDQFLDTRVSFQLAPIPVPPGIWLALSGILALAGVRCQGLRP